MANVFVDELKKLSNGLAITDAAQRRLYFEEQLKATKLNLVKAEEALKAFGEKTGIMQVEEQGKAVIEGIANLRAQIAAREVEIKVMKSYSTPNNPDLRKLEDGLRALRAEAKKMEEKGGNGYDPLMPAGRMPALGLEFMRMTRDVKFNEKLFEMLTTMYEGAKLEEAKTTSVIQVVDTAIPSDKKEKPKRALLVLIGMSAGFFLSLFGVLVLETKERIMTDPENTVKIETLRKFRSFPGKVFGRKQ
jgi:capsule polysaccharide export protein KpsE/RkpR